MKQLHTILFILSISVLFSVGCTKDITEPITGGETGKTVTVALEMYIPKAETPLAKASSRAAEEGFSVEFDQEESPSATRSDGTTKLYNLWLFQFNADGSINGLPHKISSEATAINDMVLLDVPLNVATNQTIYLLALGRQIEGDLMTLRTFDQVENYSFDYTVAQGGINRSKVTSEDDMPFAGYVKGVNVVEVSTGENRGQIEYNVPDGFVGGINIRRLMSKITLKYKFEVPSYKLDGMRLVKANSLIRLKNPDKNDEWDNYVSLEGTISNTADAEGYYTVTWFTAQNQQGSVETISTESDRFYLLEENGTHTGTAPVNGVNIEAWAYLKTAPDSYAIYQMYVGKNNTTNFDVTANTHYNLRTTINTDLESAKNDGRVRAYNARQAIYLRASGRVASTVQGEISRVSDGYDLDAHFNCRPLTIHAKGRVVSVGIYTDEACTQLADPATSWLKLSSSSNYTDAINNKVEPLCTSTLTDIIQLPTQLHFYLYSDEYLYDQTGRIPAVQQKRRLYIRAETTTPGVLPDKINRNSVVYYFDQRTPYYIGRFGGKQANGQYSEGLCMDDIAEYRFSYVEDPSVIIATGLYRGYESNEPVNGNPLYNGVIDPTNGWLGTIQLVTNPGNLVVNKNDKGQTLNFKNPVKRNGNVMLYQYTASSGYAARYCYDLNRDENGDGILQDDEVKWYMPGIYQLFGLWTYVDLSVSSTFWNRGGTVNIPASTFSASYDFPAGITMLNNNYTAIFSISGESAYNSAGTPVGPRCVRNVNVQNN